MEATWAREAADRKNRCVIVLVTAVLLAGTACHDTSKSEQRAALENAYQLGLLTKDEYTAKRLALTGSAPEEMQAPVRAFNPEATVAQAPAPVPVAVPTTVPDATPDQMPVPATVTNAAPPVVPVRKEVATPAPPAVSAAPSTAIASVPHRDDAHEPEPVPLAGCEDAEYKSGGQKGVEERFFAASPEVVRHAAVSALGSLDFNIHKDSNREIEASKRRHIGAIVGAGGERVILSLQKTQRAGRSGTLVTGTTKKSLVGRVGQRTWTDAVLAQIACKITESSR